MKMKSKKQTYRLALATVLLLLSLSVTYGQKTRAEQTLRDLDTEWSAAAGAKNLDKTVSYYAEGALVMPPNAPAATTKDAIRQMWKELIESPGAAISWKTTKVEIARSGELAYSSGTYEFTMNDASGKPVPDHGKYLEVWKKQPDGDWKVVADIWNSDVSVPAPTGKK